MDASTKWIQNGITVAGDHGDGNGKNQLSNPCGLAVDDHQTVYIADSWNHRIVAWELGATTGRVVAGGNGGGNRADQLTSPTGVIIDKKRDCLIVCEHENKRVVRWPCKNGTRGETIISGVQCYGLTMDDQGYLYIPDYNKHEVRRYRIGDTQGTVVAGGNGSGNRLDQLNCPRYVCVDREQSVYVSDYNNRRVTKWKKDAREGVFVAQLSLPYGVVVDHLGTVYVADHSNHQIMRWPQGVTHGTVIIGGNGRGNQPNKLSCPHSLAFDQHGSLYVSDLENHRIQRFNVDRN
ncbi:unnamed protein product [Adineta steineri]|uniref:Uncharacterized protein n=1 Tax=Adineta steineri TaxID=433720 RepID=A0A815P811_9BILA|nr:unnamed protein product [Adineta steineri]CAF1629028.1 unnamed protein product [Adineta steineri]